MNCPKKHGIHEPITLLSLTWQQKQWSKLERTDMAKAEVLTVKLGEVAFGTHTGGV